MDSNKMADTDAKSQASLLHGITFLCTSLSLGENTFLPKCQLTQMSVKIQISKAGWMRAKGVVYLPDTQKSLVP